jgi:hypothetical protein
MDDRSSQFRQQRILLGVSDRQLSKPTGKIFGEAMRALHKVFHGDRLERNRTTPFAQPFHSPLKSRERC